nr:tetratricopeptide repeat protein [Rhizobium gei]
MHAASIAAVVALALSGCTTQKKELTTGSIPSASFSKPVQSMNATELAGAAETVGKAYERNPNDRNAGLNYANVLKMTGRNQQALAVMQQVAIRFPTDREVLAAYGKSQAAAGQLEQALVTISRAQTPDRPDWKLKSAEGAILDQLGRASEARERYREALQIQPNEPTVLSNIGMSYLLNKDLKTAETYLRSAVEQPGADSSVRQNLALAIGLQGRFAEAEKIAKQELSPDQAEANLRYLRSIMSQQNAWQKLAKEDQGTN